MHSPCWSQCKLPRKWIGTVLVMELIRGTLQGGEECAAAAIRTAKDDFSFREAPSDDFTSVLRHEVGGNCEHVDAVQLQNGDFLTSTPIT